MWPTVEPQDQAKEFDLGFGPILNWLRVIGIELKYDQSNRCRIVFIFYQIGLFLGCISLHFSNIVELFVSTEGFEVWVEEKVHTDTFRMVSKGDVINTFILAEGTHILLIIPLRSRWRNLWRSMQELRQLMASNFNDRLRRMNLIGIAYIILSVELTSFYRPASLMMAGLFYLLLFNGCYSNVTFDSILSRWSCYGRPIFTFTSNTVKCTGQIL